MKYDLSKLSKADICALIKSLPPKFDGIYCYAPSHENKLVNMPKNEKENIIELYDDEKKLHDKWGEYDVVKNSLFIMAWDHLCFWKVGVYLYEDHFEIPKYRQSVNEYENERSFVEYRKTLAEILNKKDNTKLTPISHEAKSKKDDFELTM